MKVPLDQIGRDALKELAKLQRLFFWLRVFTRLRPDDQHILLLWSALVGFVGAWAAVAFTTLTSGVQWLLSGHHGGYVEVFRQLEWWQRLTIPAIGGLLAGVTLMFGHRLVRTKAPDYMEAISVGDGHLPLRASLVRSGSALFSIASGEAIGREGPLVQLAALGASVTGTFRRMPPARLRLLVACGAAAGIASAYHTALGGALFVSEIVLGSIAMESLGPLLIASVVAAVTTRALGDSRPIYGLSEFTLGSGWEIPLYAGLGVVCGISSHLWMRILRGGKTLFNKVLPGPAWIRLALGGLAVGAFAVLRPEVTGNGGSVIRSILSSEFTWDSVAIILALKIAATTAAFGSGAAGGVFTPSLLVGGAGGFLFAAAMGAIWPFGHLSADGFVLVGMGAFLAAAAQAPVTAILMLFEMTLQYEIVVPLMIAAVIAHYTARSLGSESLYRENLRSGPRSVFDRPLRDVSVGDLMRTDPPKVPRDARLRVIAARFLRGAGRELWVTGDADLLLGVVLLPDVAPFLKDPLLADAVIAADIMQDPARRLSPDTSLPNALEAFSRNSYERLPIIDPEGRIIGAISRADLFLAISEITRREGTR